MSRRVNITVTAALAVAAVCSFSSAASATVHEITASYCSGGDVGNFVGNAVAPPGVEDPARDNFARPVIASGAVDLEAGVTTTDAPQVKVLPGIYAPDLVLNAGTIDHPSEHCAALQR